MRPAELLLAKSTLIALVQELVIIKKIERRNEGSLTSFAKLSNLVIGGVFTYSAYQLLQMTPKPINPIYNDIANEFKGCLAAIVGSIAIAGKELYSISLNMTKAVLEHLANTALDKTENQLRAWESYNDKRPIELTNAECDLLCLLLAKVKPGFYDLPKIGDENVKEKLSQILRYYPKVVLTELLSLDLGYAQELTATYSLSTFG